MPLKQINPEALFQTNVFAQAVKVHNQALVFTSGQVAWDAERKLVGEGDLKQQTLQIFRNIQSILDTVGANWTNVVKLSIYVVQFQPDEHHPIILEALTAFLDPNHLPANTLIGVQSLAHSSLLIEVEAIIALDLT